MANRSGLKIANYLPFSMPLGITKLTCRTKADVID
jgi:hypothetical protein